MKYQDWVVLVIDIKTNNVDLFRNLDDEAMHFPSQIRAEDEVLKWDTSGKMYRYINLNN